MISDRKKKKYCYVLFISLGTNNAPIVAYVRIVFNFNSNNEITGGPISGCILNIYFYAPPRRLSPHIGLELVE